MFKLIHRILKKRRVRFELTKNRAATDCSNHCATSAYAPDRTRTCDLLLRRQSLYPTELQGPYRNNKELYLKCFYSDFYNIKIICYWNIFKIFLCVLQKFWNIFWISFAYMRQNQFFRFWLFRNFSWLSCC